MDHRHAPKLIAFHLNRTTIIECLKYAVTGSLPPGKNAGQAFVHYPKCLSQSEVKTRIKLELVDGADKSMVVERRMVLTQMKSTLSFSAVNGQLRTMSGENIVSMNHKGSEIDQQVRLFLGVSKPILEHVVFCHQEDSNWPLMDRAVLKKQFDAIIDSI